MNKLERTTTGYRVSMVMRDDDVETLLCEFLNETMVRLRDDVEKLKWLSARAVLQAREQEDLEYEAKMLSHCAAVYDYYGGNLKGRQRE
jgi:hypothetical protein